MSTEPAKKPTRRAAPKKVTPAKPRAAAPARPKKGPKIIRNLHTVGVHVRIENPLREKKFRVELRPRGAWGDTATIPTELQESHEYRNGLGILFEVITETEARAIEYPQVGYTPRQVAPVLVREEDTVISRHPNWDGKGQPPSPDQHPTGPNIVAKPGSALGPGQGIVPSQPPEGGFQTNEQILQSMIPRQVVLEKGHRHNG